MGLDFDMWPLVLLVVECDDAFCILEPPYLT